MGHQGANRSRTIFAVLVSVIGAFALIVFPTFISGAWKILSWAVVAVSAISSGVFHHLDKSTKNLPDQETERKRHERSKRRRDEKLRQEQKLEKANEKLTQKEKRSGERRAKVKEEIIEQATQTWSGRVDYAKEQEQEVRKIIDKTNLMSIREAAGHVTVEWNEATILAQWTMQQLTMFAELPDAKMDAREEAQDAIIESMRIKESGGLWTFEQGKELAEKKEAARLELKKEEDRIDNMRSDLDNAELKWKAAERRIGRLKGELDKHIANYARWQK